MDNCECDVSTIKLPVKGLEITVDAAALGGAGCNCELATTERAGLVKPDNATIKVDTDGVISAEGISGGGINYSMEEQWTGGHWINGKKIYRKVVACGALPNNSIRQVPHGISNIEKCIRLYGWAVKPGYCNPLPYASPTGADMSLYLIGADNIGMQTSTNQTAYAESYVIVEYTCTDR